MLTDVRRIGIAITVVIVAIAVALAILNPPKPTAENYARCVDLVGVDYKFLCKF